MRESPRAGVAAYGAAVLATAVSLLVRWPLWPALGSSSPFLTFVPAVLFAAYYRGLRPGLVATLLGAAAADFFLIEPFFSLRITSIPNAVVLILFLLIGTLISVLCESLHRARARLLAHERQRAKEALRETEERFRQLAENIREIFWMQEGNWTRTLYVDPTYEVVWGRTCQSLYEQPRSWIESVHPQDRDVVLAHLEQQERGVSTDTEFRVMRPDHSIRWVRCRAFPIKNQAGQVHRIAGLAEDITERKQAEEALMQERYLLHTLMDNLPDNMYFKDADSRFVRINQALTTYFGLGDPAQALGKTDFDFYTEEHAREAYADEQEIIRTGQPVVGKEEKETWLDGRVKWVSSTKMPFRDQDGQIIGTFGVSRDITDLKRLESGLRQANERLELAIRGSNICLWEHDMPDGILERGRLSLISSLQPISDECPLPTDAAGALARVHPEDRERVMQMYDALLPSTGTEFELEYRIQPEGGSCRHLLTRGLVVRDAQGRPERLLGTSIDVTDLKRAEVSLRESERRFRTFVDHATDAFFLLENNLVILDVNCQACQSLGYTREELVGMTQTDLDPNVTPADLENIGRRLHTGETIAIESRHRRKDGTIFPVEIRAQAFREGGRWFTVALARDITERKQAEEKLRESEERFRTLADNIAQLIWMADENRWDLLVQPPLVRLHRHDLGGDAALGLAAGPPPRPCPPRRPKNPPLLRDRRRSGRIPSPSAARTAATAGSSPAPFPSATRPAGYSAGWGPTRT